MSRGEPGPIRPYADITVPKRAERLLDLMIDAMSANPKGFRAAPSGKHHKGRVHRYTAVERLAATVYGV